MPRIIRIQVVLHTPTERPFGFPNVEWPAYTGQNIPYAFCLAVCEKFGFKKCLPWGVQIYFPPEPRGIDHNPYIDMYQLLP